MFEPHRVSMSGQTNQIKITVIILDIYCFIFHRIEPPTVRFLSIRCESFHTLQTGNFIDFIHLFFMERVCLPISFFFFNSLKRKLNVEANNHKEKRALSLFLIAIFFLDLLCMELNDILSIFIRSLFHHMCKMYAFSSLFIALVYQ